MIPYGKQFIDEDDINAVIEVLKSDYLTTGPKVVEFESALCKVTNNKYAVAVSNGTAALHLAALVLFNENDEVIVPPNTFLASVNAIIYAKAKPIFCDILEDGNVDLDKAYELCENNPNIKGIVAVHFSGKPVDFKKLQTIKDKFGLKVIEDGAHALGMCGVGSVGDLTILSFHPVKHITTGEGGAVIANNEVLAKQIAILRTHGMTKENFVNKELAYDKHGNVNPWYYEMSELGFNYRITDFACALGISQLLKLPNFIKKRKAIAKRYEEAFLKIEHIKPLYSYDENSSYHLFVVLIEFDAINKTKAELFNFMRENSVILQTHYIPVNAQPYYANLGYKYTDTPKAFEYYEMAVSLPIYYSLNELNQEEVIELIKIFLTRN